MHACGHYLDDAPGCPCKKSRVFLVEWQDSNYSEQCKNDDENEDSQGDPFFFPSHKVKYWKDNQGQDAEEIYDYWHYLQE